MKNEKKGCISGFFSAVHEGYFGADYFRSKSAWGNLAPMVFVEEVYEKRTIALVHRKTAGGGRNDCLKLGRKLGKNWIWEKSVWEANFRPPYLSIQTPTENLAPMKR